MNTRRYRSFVVVGLLAAHFFLVCEMPVRAEKGSWVGGNFGMLGGNDELRRDFAGGVQAGAYWNQMGASVHVLRYSGQSAQKSISKNSVALTPVMLNAFSRIETSPDVCFRLGGGLSYVHVEHSIDPDLQSLLLSNGLEGSEEIQSGFGQQLLFGLDLMNSRQLSVGVDAVYLFFRPETTSRVARLGGGSSLSANTAPRMDAFIATINVKYHFN